MLESPVKPLIASLALPSIISMLCTSFYNMADTYFVSKLDTASTAAVGVTFATMAIIHAIAFFFGIGSGNSMSRLLGARKRPEAEVMASTAFFYAFMCGVLIAIFGNLFAAQLAMLIGSTPTILPYAIQYMGIILVGAPWMMTSLVMNNHLRFQGSAAFGMVGITIGGFLNVFLDPLFIFTFHMGVAGAALATILSQGVSFCILFAMTRQGGNIPIRLRNIHPSWAIWKEIVAGGAPSLVRQGTQSLSTIFLNVSAGAFGDAAIAAMSIVTRLSFFAASVIIGFGQGFQPVCGFSYGAKKFGRLREGFWFAVKAGTMFSLGAALVAIILPLPSWSSSGMPPGDCHRHPDPALPGLYLCPGAADHSDEYVPADHPPYGGGHAGGCRAQRAVFGAGAAGTAPDLGPGRPGMVPECVRSVRVHPGRRADPDVL